MDAVEADLDAKLYKASGDIIPELQVKLPKLIWHDGATKKKLRTHVLYGKCEEVKTLLDRFQEWPQLLDPHLASLVGNIVDGFLTFTVRHPEAYTYPTAAKRSAAVPLPLALSQILYTFCKVRGYKVIVRLLNNEPKHVEPMLRCYRTWSSRQGGAWVSVAWEEKYIMLLWLSHLMLAPFELSSLSTSNIPDIDNRVKDLADGLPEVAVDVISLAFQSLSSPSKERESAVILLVRLALRRDMQAAELPRRLVDYATGELLEDATRHQAGVYHAIGHLSLLYSIMNLGTDTEVMPFLTRVYDAIILLATSKKPHHAAVTNSAPARKLIVKTRRVCLTHAIARMDVMAGLVSDAVIPMLENGIQHYLEALGDKDSPVRMAASKALSMVTLKLDESMAAEIVESVLASLSENVLLEDLQNNRLTAKTDLPIDESSQMRRNVSAVNPLRWHGLMLTLGHLLFRRSPPPRQLPDIIEAVLLGLEFEQRSNVGTSIGVGVRDGACFAIWALARKYSTKELESISAQEVAGLAVSNSNASESVLQLVAIRLMLSACLDPSGNIRRGSSAALQELIGRHPDTIIEGIPVVQVVDYQAVARRSRAILEVATQAAALNPVYHHALLEALLDWRGARAADVESRRWAAIAMNKLCYITDTTPKKSLLRKVLRGLQSLNSRNLGTTAGARHGLLLSVAAIVESINWSQTGTEGKLMLPTIEQIDIVHLAGDLHGRVTVDLENVMEGVGTCIRALASSASLGAKNGRSGDILAIELLPVLEHCILTCNKPLPVESCAGAMKALFQILDQDKQRSLLSSWIASKSQKVSEMVGIGRLTAIARLYSSEATSSDFRERIATFLTGIVEGDFDIETRTYAMDSIGAILRSSSRCTEDAIAHIRRAVVAGLNDYTNDQRGDIGSILRLAGLEAVDSLRGIDDQDEIPREIMVCVARLAAEKLNKVRHRAWLSVRKTGIESRNHGQSQKSFEHLQDVSSEEYYFQLLHLLRFEDMREALVSGLASSAAGSTEEIGRACCSALVAYFRSSSAEDQRGLAAQLMEDLLNLLEKANIFEDREVLPKIEFLTFLVDNDLVQVSNLHEPLDLWKTTQKVHVTNASFERVDVLIKLYYALVRFEDFRLRALDKLTRQLLHRYPRIRNAAADVLYAEAMNQTLVECDWNASVASNKPTVLELRKSLNCIKVARG